MGRKTNDVKATLNNVSKTATLISKTLKRNSISRNSKDSIFEYPFFVDGDIDTNEILTFGKAYERQIAAMVISQISLNNVVNLKKYGSVQNWLKTIHNNSDIPSNIMVMIQNATEAINIPIEEKIEIAVECWRKLYPENGLDMTPINEMYKPFRETQSIMEDGIKLATASEAYDDTVDDNRPMFGNKSLRDAHKTMRNVLNISDDSDSGSGVGVGYRQGKGKVTVDKKNNTTTTDYGMNFQGASKYQIINDERTNTMAPTMINVDLVCQGSQIGGHDNMQFVTNVVIGVKTMIRRIRSDSMVANMVDAVRGSNSIFDFIKYTDNEKNSVIQFLIKPFTDGKDMAIGKNSGDDGFVKALQRRKSFNVVSKIGGGNIPPHTVIIISTYTAARVKDITGVDLMDPYYVMKIIYKYYILGFGIYDMESKVMLSMFDGDNAWSTNTLYSLGVANKSAVNFADMAETKALMGRR